jgi:hypothetical protein
MSIYPAHENSQIHPQSVKGSSLEKAEERILDWNETPDNDGMFGQVIGRASCGSPLSLHLQNLVIIFAARRIQVSALDVSFLEQGWTADTVEHGLVQTRVHSDTARSGTSWTAIQV